MSPICNNHQLLVPNLKDCYNQVWRYDLTENWIVFCENSERDDYVLFFNSLCGFSSVNHLHVLSFLFSHVVASHVHLLLLRDGDGVANASASRQLHSE